jgi:hypothetical protein
MIDKEKMIKEIIEIRSKLNLKPYETKTLYNLSLDELKRIHQIQLRLSKNKESDLQMPKKSKNKTYLTIGIILLIIISVSVVFLIIKPIIKMENNIPPSTEIETCYQEGIRECLLLEECTDNMFFKGECDNRTFSDCKIEGMCCCLIEY